MIDEKHLPELKRIEVLRDDLQPQVILRLTFDGGVEIDVAFNTDQARDIAKEFVTTADSIDKNWYDPNLDYYGVDDDD